MTRFNLTTPFIKNFPGGHASEGMPPDPPRRLTLRIRSVLRTLAVVHFTLKHSLLPTSVKCPPSALVNNDS